MLLMRLQKKWKRTVILYVVGAEPTIAALERFIAGQWNFVAKPEIYYHNEGYYMILFDSIEDRNEVVYSGPHTMNSRPIIVKPWTAHFDLHNEVLKTIPPWVQFPNLPLNCWTKKALSKIGVLSHADSCTTHMERISYARILTEMDIT